MQLSSTYLLIAKFFFKLPKSVKTFLGRAIGITVFDLLRFRRKIILGNLTRAFPELSQKEKIALGRESIVVLGHQVIEFFGLPFMTEEWVDRNVIFDGWDHYQKAQNKGKGVLLLGMHMGSGECAIGAMCLRGMPLVLIGKRFRQKGPDHILYASRAATGAEFIPPHGKTTANLILKNLRENKSIIFVLDQHINPPYGIATTFFGHHVGTGFGLALFAQKTGAPVIPLNSFRDKQGRNHVVFGPEVPFTKCESKEATLKRMTQTYNHVIENTVREHPGQWMWIHKRWKPFPKETSTP